MKKLQTEEEIARFTALFPEHTNKELATMFNMSIHTVQSWGIRLGLRKSKERLIQNGRNARSTWTLSEESKDKIRQTLTGRKIGPEAGRKSWVTARKRGTAVEGEKHPWWNGGTTVTRFADPRYKEWRNNVLRCDNYHCLWCGKAASESKHGSGLDCHHVKSWKYHEDLRYDLDNGMSLCRSCHKFMHNIVGFFS